MRQRPRWRQARNVASCAASSAAGEDPRSRRVSRRHTARTLPQSQSCPPVADDDGLADPRQVDLDLLDLLDLRRAMSAMDRQDRRLLIGHYWQDLPNSELAMQLGLAEVTVRVRLHRLRRRLRDILVEA